MFVRSLEIGPPKGLSVFLWGPRKTGKTTFLRERFPDSVRYDLLESKTFLRFLKEPQRFHEELAAAGEEAFRRPIIIDEVQKVPALLDEVHWFIENRGAVFIMCGSSPRKLRREGANLLGGRALSHRMHPLTVAEVPGFDLKRAFETGLIPAHYTGPDHCGSLRAYVFDYLQEEIRAEGLSRKLPAFSRFLDAAAFSSGELVNYSNVARDCGVDAKTVREYYRILEETMLGYLIPPFAKSAGRQLIIAAPKFYWFDLGIANALTDQWGAPLRSPYGGRQFENFILMEIMAYRDYRHARFPVSFWRTKMGLEVDFVLGKDVAVEVKASEGPDRTELRGLRAFLEEHPKASGIVVSDDPRPRRIEEKGRTPITVLPWREFIARLWAGEII